MTRQTRERLLALAAEEELLLLEDNPYGMFHDGPCPLSRHWTTGGGLPRLLRQDRPRVGYVIADQPVHGGDQAETLADQLAKIKSMITVNTSPRR